MTAGVTGAGIAMPLLAASGAQAADTATWDRVAQCESGGVWSADAGNGYYGGLQITQELWDRYGGAAYASRPDLASRSQQIVVAESILKARGPQAWQGCAESAGLTKGGGAPGVDPGSTRAPEPSHSPSTPSTPSPTSPGSSSPSGTPKPSGSGAPSHTPAPSHSGTRPKADPSGRAGSSDSSGASDRTDESDASGATDATDSSGTSDPSDARDSSGSSGTSDSPGSSGSSDSAGKSGTGDRDGSGTSGPGATDPTTDPGAPGLPGAGKHRGGPDGDAGQEGDGRGSGGRHASRGGDTHRDHPPVRTDYVVRPGDNLSVIAEDSRTPGGWPALYKANKDVIGDDPDLILPGQRLEVGR
ncbi:transglycosylase family protein [Streptomyces sp. MST-110588]|uniref:transglycosylase family protein n=1 Tax=Streptomyces sp. MST-110588 TaxID=2833628 RepID=UPI003242BA01